MDKKLTNLKQAKILVGFSCNNNCIFCYEKRHRSLPDKTTKEIKAEIKKARRLGFYSLHLIGGEPTLRSDIYELVRFAKGIGFKYVSLTTNGRIFAYLDFAKQLIETGISQIIFSIHGHSALMHDSLTSSKGSFYQTRRGIENLRTLGFKQIGVNTTVLSQNFRYLNKIAKIINDYGVSRWELIWVAAEKNNFKKLTPTIVKAAPFINKVLAIGKKKKWRWNLLNPPMGCHFASFDDSVRYGDSREERLFLKNKKSQSYFITSKEKILNYKKIKKCLRCNLKLTCPGVEATYLKIYGTEEVRPIL